MLNLVIICARTRFQLVSVLSFRQKRNFFLRSFKFDKRDILSTFPCSSMLTFTIDQPFWSPEKTHPFAKSFYPFLFFNRPQSFSTPINAFHPFNKMTMQMKERFWCIRPSVSRNDVIPHANCRIAHCNYYSNSLIFMTCWLGKWTDMVQSACRLPSITDDTRPNVWHTLRIQHTRIEDTRFWLASSIGFYDFVQLKLFTSVFSC